MPLQQDDLVEAAELWSSDPSEVLRALGYAVNADVADAFNAVRTELQSRADASYLRYPQKFRLGSSSLELLYLTVRSLRPEVVVETGVADGWSSAVILAALEANGSGTLHSIDIEDNCGVLVKSGHPRWKKYVTDGSADQLALVLSGVPAVDVFLHDSDHSYRAQAAEYRRALEVLRSGGLLMSDDVNWSNAFLDLCRDRGFVPLVLCETTKLTGVVRLQVPKAEAEVEAVR